MTLKSYVINKRILLLTVVKHFSKLASSKNMRGINEI